jgi:ParB family chromosome partitioning protein
VVRQFVFLIHRMVGYRRHVPRGTLDDNRFFTEGDTMTPKVRSRLGRGLSSLISVSVEQPNDAPVETQSLAVAEAAAIENGTLGREIPVGEITPNPNQPRRSFDDALIRQLAQSLKASGLIQPIVVRATEGGYQLIAGERRLRAARLAGFVTIPAIVRDVDQMTQAQMALIENIQREDLNPLDRAAAYRSLLQQLGLTQSELAGRLGEDRSTIANHVRLLDLTEAVQQMIRSGSLSLGHAKLLAGIDDPLEQERLAKLVNLQDLSVRNLERLLQQQSANDPPSTRSTSPTAYITELEKTISRQLGMRTQVHRGSKGKGRLVIHYASLDQFDQLIAKLGVDVE